MLNPEELDKAKKVQLGLSQFEQTHLPVTDGKMLICPTCDVDFPCERMLIFMLLQSITALGAMIPSGNMAGIMQRFNKK